METKRLKNIIILILALLNVFLLVLLFHFRWQQAVSAHRLREQLYALYADSEVLLPDEKDLSLDQTPPFSLILQRDLSHEAEIAAYLLGEETEGFHQGGGIYTYDGERGTVYFRSNGSFDYAPDAQRVSPTSFCKEFCERFGYASTQTSLSSSFGTFTACRIVDDTPVYNCTISFLFEDGALISLSGSCLSTAGSSPLAQKQFSATDALVKFLDYRKVSGVICNAVTGMKCVYEYQSATQAPMLAAKWQISTDTYQYYVDCSTGAVNRA